jgi:anti-anti-sigma regulatory factor
VNEVLVRAPATLDWGTRLRFRQEALAAVDECPAVGGEEGGRVIVDLGETTRVDSAGLRAMILVRERAAQERWTVCLRGASEELRFLLVLTRLEDCFEFEPPAA